MAALTYHQVLTGTHRPLTGLKGLEVQTLFPLTCMLAKLKSTQSALMQSQRIVRKALQSYQGPDEQSLKERYKALEAQCNALLPSLDAQQNEMETAIDKTQAACAEVHTLTMAPVKKAIEEASNEQRAALEVLQQAASWEELGPWIAQYTPDAKTEVATELRSCETKPGFDFGIICHTVAGCYTDTHAGADQGALDAAQQAHDEAQRMANASSEALSASTEALIAQATQPITQLRGILRTIKNSAYGAPEEEQTGSTASYAEDVVESSNSQGEASPLGSRQLMGHVQMDDQANNG